MNEKIVFRSRRQKDRSGFVTACRFLESDLAREVRQFPSERILFAVFFWGLMSRETVVRERGILFKHVLNKRRTFCFLIEILPCYKVCIKINVSFVNK